MMGSKKPQLPPLEQTCNKIPHPTSPPPPKAEVEHWPTKRRIESDELMRLRAIEERHDKLVAAAKAVVYQTSIEAYKRLGHEKVTALRVVLEDNNG